MNNRRPRTGCRGWVSTVPFGSELQGHFRSPRFANGCTLFTRCIKALQTTRPVRERGAPVGRGEGYVARDRSLHARVRPMARSPIVFVPKTYADVELRIPNIDKARARLGYEPQVHLEEGLRRTAAWYREQLGGSSELAEHD